MVTVDGGPVVAHAQAFADEINRRWGFTHIMTYPGHEPDQQHALDNFQTRDVMLKLADWCTHDDVIDQYGIDYVIFNVDESTVGGEIYNREIARYWRHMPDRGSPTQNHHDHVHVSFNPTAKGPFGPTTPPQEEHDLPRYIRAKDDNRTFEVHSLHLEWVPTTGVLEFDTFGKGEAAVTIVEKTDAIWFRPEWYVENGVVKSKPVTGMTPK